jgi:hypothetical protein
MCIENIEYFMIQYLEQENIPVFPDVKPSSLKFHVFHFSQIIFIFLFRIKRKIIIQSFVCRMLVYVSLSYSLPLRNIFRKATFSKVILDRPESAVSLDRPRYG